MVNTNQIVAGSKVRCVNASNDESESLKKGEIYTVGAVFGMLFAVGRDLVGDPPTVSINFKTPKLVLHETSFPYYFDVDRFELVQE